MEGGAVTDHEWDRCADPRPMLEFLRGKAGERKLRLFAVAACRRIWHLLTEESARRAVEAAERYADGAASPEELEAAARPLRWQPGTSIHKRPKNASAAALWALWGPWSSWSDLPDAVGRSTGYAARAKGSGKGQRTAQAGLLRDLFGPLPFRSLAADPAWLAWHGGAVKLAQAVYDERELPSGHLNAARLAVLADMLEEAGCSDRQLLGHLRGPGPHIRDCWVVDLLLGKG
jgi:hypothetical protein